MMVVFHEITLSFMLTNVSHVVVFITLVLADVFENFYCVWSLYRTSLKKLRQIVPAEIEVGDESATKQGLMKRSSSVRKLTQVLESEYGNDQRGTLLFIAATLLQRELVETIVPIQGMGVLSALYLADVKSNTINSSWKGSEEIYHQTLLYTGLDFVIEIVVFLSTIVILKRLFPELKPWRILSGLIRTNTTSMIMGMVISWSAMLMFQCTFLGLDTSFRFEWIGCMGKENSTWVGGFDWEC